MGHWAKAPRAAARRKKWNWVFNDYTDRVARSCDERRAELAAKRHGTKRAGTFTPSP
jgi:hypothetical protein